MATLDARSAGTGASGALRRKLAPYLAVLVILFRRPGALVGAVLLLLIGAVALVGPSLAPRGPQQVDVMARLQGPSAAHWLGTDHFGRDVLSRMLHGARYTLWIGLSSVLISSIVGTAAGIASGYFGGWQDEALGRLMDMLLAFPSLFLGLAVVAIFGPGMNNAILAVGVVGVPRFARVARSSVLSVKERDMVEAARAIGSAHGRILWRHILPNCAGPLVVYATLWSATAVIHASGLSFLGVGVQPPTPEWGAMLADAQQHLLTQPLLSVYPGVAISLLVLGLNLVGDGLRDYLDPHSRATRRAP